jgi:hypothetical protein
VGSNLNYSYHVGHQHNEELVQADVQVKKSKITLRKKKKKSKIINCWGESQKGEKSPKLITVTQLFSRFTKITEIHIFNVGVNLG